MPCRAPCVIVALVAVALYRPRALPLLHAAGLVSVMIYLGIIPPATIGSDLSARQSWASTACRWRPEMP